MQIRGGRKKLSTTTLSRKSDDKNHKPTVSTTFLSKWEGLGRGSVPHAGIHHFCAEPQYPQLPASLLRLSVRTHSLPSTVEERTTTEAGSETEALEQGGFPDGDEEITVSRIVPKKVDFTSHSPLSLERTRRGSGVHSRHHHHAEVTKDVVQQKRYPQARSSSHSPKKQKIDSSLLETSVIQDTPTIYIDEADKDHDIMSIAKARLKRELRESSEPGTVGKLTGVPVSGGVARGKRLKVSGKSLKRATVRSAGREEKGGRVSQPQLVLSGTKMEIVKNPKR